MVFTEGAVVNSEYSVDIDYIHWWYAHTQAEVGTHREKLGLPPSNSKKNWNVNFENISMCVEIENKKFWIKRRMTTLVASSELNKVVFAHQNANGLLLEKFYISVQ